MEELQKLCNDLKLEIVSRTGIVPTKSYTGCSSYFDTIFSVVYYRLIGWIHSLNDSTPEGLLKAYKDKFVNDFMVLHHNIVVKACKFNWND